MTSPLAEFMPFGRYRGTRISLLPHRYLAWARRRDLPQVLRAALLAVEAFRTLDLDQQEGRH